MSPSSEAYLFAAQELAIITRFHEKNILKSRSEDTCRMCFKAPERIGHILTGCDVLAGREYLKRHNDVARYVHKVICEYYGVKTKPKWHEHSPKDVILCGSVEIIWDQVLITDRQIGANRPDVVVRDKKNKKVWILDVACPSDVNVVRKESEKINKYCGLKAELGKMWRADVVIIPVVIGSLGTVSNKLEAYLKEVPGCPSMEMCQKITLLGSERILHSFLSSK